MSKLRGHKEVVENLDKIKTKAIVPISKEEMALIGDAHYAWTAIQESSYHIASHCLRLGKYFRQLRDKKLYKYIFGQDGDTTWTGFLANPEVKFSQSSVYNFIELYELWILRLGYREENITDVGYKRLMLVTPITRKNPDQADKWLSEARVLSQSDLINTVRASEGKPPMIPRKNFQLLEDSPVFSSYRDFVKSHPCILHPARPSEYAHFPLTDKMGGKFGVPLCRECHAELHQIGDISWYSKYKRKLGEYLEGLIAQMEKKQCME